MKSNTILFTLGGALTFSPQKVAATCYGSGNPWPSAEQARAYVHDACYNQGGMFTGYYAAHQTKAMCPNGLLFEVQNLNPQDGFDLGDDDCYFRLTNEIFGCANGGESVISGWRFRADPGAC